MLNLNQLLNALPQHKSYQIPQSGLPFYDACVLLGAMHYFFGKSACTLEERSGQYLIEGAFLGRDIEHYQERLKGKGLERIETTTLSLLEQLDPSQIEAYFSGERNGVEEVSVSRYLEPTLASGSRSFDAARYNTMASEQGLPLKRPLPEVAMAALGLTRCSLVYGQDEVLLLVPVFAPSQVPHSPHIQTQQTQHKAPLAGAWLCALQVKEASAFAIKDFAIAYHGPRGFYYSRLLGLKELPPQLSEQVVGFLSASRDGLAELGLALAHFLENPSPKTLETVVFSKAKTLGQKLDNYSLATARALLSGAAAQEAWALCKGHTAGQEVVADLTEALGMVLKEDPRPFFALANSSTPESFYGQLTQLLSRQIAGAQAKGRNNYASTLITKISAASTEDLLGAMQQQAFAEHKTRFLLGSLSY